MTKFRVVTQALVISHLLIDSRIRIAREALLGRYQALQPEVVGRLCHTLGDDFYPAMVN